MVLGLDHFTSYSSSYSYIQYTRDDGESSTLTCKELVRLKSYLKG